MYLKKYSPCENILNCNLQYLHLQICIFSETLILRLIFCVYLCDKSISLNISLGKSQGSVFQPLHNVHMVPLMGYFSIGWLF